MSSTAPSSELSEDAVYALAAYRGCTLSKFDEDRGEWMLEGSLCDARFVHLFNSLRGVVYFLTDHPFK